MIVQMLGDGVITTPYEDDTVVITAHNFNIREAEKYNMFWTHHDGNNAVTMVMSSEDAMLFTLAHPVITAMTLSEYNNLRFDALEKLNVAKHTKLPNHLSSGVDNAITAIVNSGIRLHAPSYIKSSGDFAVSALNHKFPDVC